MLKRKIKDILQHYFTFCFAVSIIAVKIPKIQSWTTHCSHDIQVYILSTNKCFKPYAQDFNENVKFFLVLSIGNV